MTEKLNFKKYGFERVPEEDFSDDGSHFKMYDYKGIRVSYLRHDSDVYLCARASRDLDDSVWYIKRFYKDVMIQFKEITKIENKYNGKSYFTNEDLKNYTKELDELKDKIYELKRTIEIHRINETINIYTFGDHSWCYEYEDNGYEITQQTRVVNFKENYPFKVLSKAGFKIQEKMLKLDHIVDREWR